MLGQALCRIIVWRPRRATRCGWKPRFIQRKCTEPRLHAEALLLLVGSYCFAAQVLVVASHTPPALSQSAFVLAVVTSAAKADAAKATPRANANAYAMLLMVLSLYKTQQNPNSPGLRSVSARQRRFPPLTRSTQQEARSGEDGRASTFGGHRHHWSCRGVGQCLRTENVCPRMKFRH